MKVLMLMLKMASIALWTTLTSRRIPQFIRLMATALACIWMPMKSDGMKFKFSFLSICAVNDHCTA